VIVTPFLRMIIELKCTNCGATINSENEKLLFCPYCGAKFIVKEEASENKYQILGGVLKSYVYTDCDLVIPEGVTIISKELFKDNKTIKSVILPESLTEIDDGAFENCTGLSKITFPRSLLRIGKSAFKNSGLVEVSLPKNLEIVDEEAFMECKQLKSVIVNSSPKIQYRKTFKKCENLNEVNVDLQFMFPSFLASNQTKKFGDVRSTFYDLFQGTPYFNKLKNRVVNEKKCLFCGGETKKRIFTEVSVCKSCGQEYPGYL